MTIYDVPLTRIDELADVSAEAFVSNNDPIGNFLFQNEPNHLVLKRRFFRALVTSCSPKAVRQATSEKLEAVSIWFPPRMGHNEDVDADPFKPEDFAHPEETLARMKAVGDVIAALTAELGLQPQWYLHLAAVPPKFRGQGYAFRLAEPVMNRAKAEGLPCTLITQSAENVRTYERWGFKVTKELPVPASGEKFYAMRKD